MAHTVKRSEKKHDSTISGVREGAAPPPLERRGAPMGGSLILQMLAFPFLRPGTVAYLGGAVVLFHPLGVPGGALPPPLENTKLKGNYV